jgi:hypothetical protein
MNTKSHYACLRVFITNFIDYKLRVICNYVKYTYFNSYAEIAKIKSVHPFTKFSKVARSFFEAFKGSESSEAIFKALTTVVKSSLYFSRNDDKEDIWILYPIVVFDGRMFDATINEIGEVSVLETEAVIFTYHYTTHDDKRTITIPIIREDAVWMSQLKSIKKNIWVNVKVPARINCDFNHVRI